MTLPTVAMKNGDFSSLLLDTKTKALTQIGTDALGRPVYQNEIYDPTTTRTVNGTVIRDPFPGNVIPPGEFSNATSVLLPLIPDPVLPGDTNNDFRLSGCCPILSRNAYTGKIDHVLTSKQKLWASYTWNH